MSKIILKGEIHWRVEFVVNDCRTYIFVRQDKDEWYSTHKPPMGGGNFLMAHGLFSALNFMGKIYAHLKHREGYFYTQQNVDDVKSTVRKLKSAEVLKAIQEVDPTLNLKQLLASSAPTRWKPGRTGECIDETSVFKIFYSAFRPEIDLGFPEDKSNEVWNSFRNRLSHMAAPRKVIESGGDPPTAFRTENDEWRVNVDRLTEDLILIEEWLARQIDDHQSEDDIRNALTLVNEQKYPPDQTTTTTSETMTTTAGTFTTTDITLSADHPPKKTDA